MTKLIKTGLLVMAFIFPFGSRAAHTDPKRPNIIFILADDMGYGDCSAYNPDSKIQTPNIDRLAREGLLFTDAHSASTTCTASRYGLLTGINPARRGVTNLIVGLGPVLEENEVTIAELLKDRGYLTTMVGKWHLGFELQPSEPRPTFDFSKPLAGGPVDHGFDSFLGLRSAVSAPPYFYIRGREPEAPPTETTPGTRTSAKENGKDSRTAYAPGAVSPEFVHEETNSRLCDDLIQSIKNHAASGESKPLFAYYAMLEPHTPWLAEERFEGKSQAGPYGDYIVQLDHEVGRVLEVLDDTGLDENTLLVFSSDNGALWRDGDIEQFGHRANGPLAGGKATPWEGGHRVPFIVRWPGRVPLGAKTDATINHTDFLATLAELFDIDLEEAAPETVPDSHSFLSVLRNPATEHQRPAMAITAGSFRKGVWKLTFVKGPRGEDPEGRDVSNAALYNLAEDLGEKQDLSESQPERKQQLFAAYREYYAGRKLKPLAQQVIARKSQKKTSSPPSKKGAPVSKHPKPAGGAPQIPSDKEQTEAQKAKRAALVAEYRERHSELQKKQAALLSAEQQQAVEGAKKMALEEGKKGMALRKAMDAAAELTGEQKAQLTKLREEMGQLTRKHREQLNAVLMDE